MPGMLDQHRSLLFRLPIELREAIYEQSLIADAPVTNPTTTLLVSPDDRLIPPLGLALARSCRRVHDEMKLEPLYVANDFKFTRPMIASWFFNHVPLRYKSLIYKITIDLGDISPRALSQSQDGGVKYEWMHYLGCTPVEHDTRLKCIYQPEMLALDLQHLRVLRFDLVSLQDRALDIARAGEFIRRVLAELFGSLTRAIREDSALPDIERVDVVGRNWCGDVICSKRRLPVDRSSLVDAGRNDVHSFPWEGCIADAHGRVIDVNISQQCDPFFAEYPGALSIDRHSTMLTWSPTPDIIPPPPTRAPGGLPPPAFSIALHEVISVERILGYEPYAAVRIRTDKIYDITCKQPNWSPEGSIAAAEAIVVVLRKKMRPG
jgi:hypothetical protein